MADLSSPTIGSQWKRRLLLLELEDLVHTLPARRRRRPAGSFNSIASLF